MGSSMAPATHHRRAAQWRAPARPLQELFLQPSSSRLTEPRGLHFHGALRTPSSGRRGLASTLALGSYRIVAAPERNSCRLTSFKSTCFDSPENLSSAGFAVVELRCEGGASVTR